MSELPPYTGHASVPEGVAPVVAGAVAPPTVVWHSRAVLIGTAALALVAGILTIIGSAHFPGAAPIEQLYCFGLLVDLAAVLVVLGALITVEFARRGVPGRLAVPVNTRISIFAIVAIGLSAIAASAWAGGGGLEQVGYLVSGIRPRYMYATGALFIAGIPWALGAIFGAWGFRPGGNRVTNVVALVAVGVWAILAVLTTIAALVYGAGLSD